VTLGLATTKGKSLLRRVSREQFIENNVIRNRHVLGLHDAVYIRRSRIGRGFGVADLIFLPLRGVGVW
jgi:hypothetical protein